LLATGFQKLNSRPEFPDEAMGKWDERSFCDKIGGNETRRIRHRM
jgi:hypothetical protein